MSNDDVSVGLGPIASQRTERFLSSAPAHASEPRERTGTSLDRYALLEPIGVGGMGEVFRAYDPLLRREVAIKLTHEAVGDNATASSTRDRLVEEARALARLNHPHVITVFDAGAVGREVFIVMELVVGRTLRAFLSTSPSFEERLEHMIAAGEGLAAAHAVGIVHRDFKPENVMIGADGRTRVLDFGISRLFETGELNATRARHVSGTPLYMPPEQWRNEDVDARSDQFSFAMTLFEVLTGGHPHAQVEREKLEALAAQGMPSKPPRLSRAAERALDAVRAAFERDPAARFPSMDALLATLRRTRRRRVPARIAAATLGVSALAGTLWAGAVGATRLREGQCAAIREDLWTEVEPALRARHEALGLSPHIFSSLESRVRTDTQAIVDAERENCLDGRVRGRASDEAMDRRTRCIDRHKRGLHALLDALTHAKESSVMVQALDAVDGLPSLGVCADPEFLREGTPLPEDPAKRARILDIQRRLDALVGRTAVDKDLAPLVAEASALVAEAEAEHHAPLLALAHATRARVTRAAGKSSDTTHDLEQAAKLASESREDVLLAAIWVLASDVASDQSKYERALALGEVAHASIARTGGDPALESRLDKALGWALRELGRFDDARAHYEAILARSGEADADLRARAGAHSGLGVLEKELGRYDEAAALYERAIALHERASGPDHPSVATVLTNLGVTRKQEGRRDEARALYMRALALYDRSLSGDDPARGITLANLGSLLVDAGEPAEARRHFEEAKRLWTLAYGPKQLRVHFVTADIANTYVREGRLAEAEPLLRQALGGMIDTLGARTWNTASVRAALAGLLARMGRHEEATREAHAAIEVAESEVKEPTILADITLEVADALSRAPNRRGEARALVSRVREKVEKDAKARERLETWIEASKRS